jgi:hypothetical protein
MRCISWASQGQVGILVSKKTIRKHAWVPVDAAKGFIIRSSLAELQFELQVPLLDIQIPFDASVSKGVLLFDVVQNPLYIHFCLISPADT